MLDHGESICHCAYHELSTCRINGMSMGPIPWSAMLKWSKHHGLGYQETQFLIAVLRRVDAVTLERAAREAKSK